MSKKQYNTPHRSYVVKTRMTEEEYADFTERLKLYEMSGAEFISTNGTVRTNSLRPRFVLPLQISPHSNMKYWKR